MRSRAVLFVFACSLLFSLAACSKKPASDSAANPADSTSNSADQNAPAPGDSGDRPQIHEAGDAMVMMQRRDL